MGFFSAVSFLLTFFLGAGASLSLLLSLSELESELDSELESEEESELEESLLEALEAFFSTTRFFAGGASLSEESSELEALDEDGEGERLRLELVALALGFTSASLSEELSSLTAALMSRIMPSPSESESESLSSELLSELLSLEEEAEELSSAAATVFACHWCQSCGREGAEASATAFFQALLSISKPSPLASFSRALRVFLKPMPDKKSATWLRQSLTLGAGASVYDQTSSESCWFAAIVAVVCGWCGCVVVVVGGASDKCSRRDG